MPFKRPTIKDLHNQIATDIETRLPGADSQLRRSVLGVLARVFSGALSGLYGYLDFIARQVFPDTAEAEFLEHWASIWGLERSPARPASGLVTLSGTDDTVIPAGTELKRGDGAMYHTSAEGRITKGKVILKIQAKKPGAAGNATPGTTLNLVAPLAGVRSSGKVSADGSARGLTKGADEEKDSALLTRLLRRIQTPPHGGARHDYVTWALDTKNHGVRVTGAWASGLESGPGTVTVRFMVDSTDNGIPLAADVAAVQSWIDRVRPVTAAVTVVAPIPAPLRFRISGLDPVSRTVRDAVEAELKDLIRREAKPGGTILISHIREAISAAAGENDHTLGAPTANITSTKGEIITFGGVNWS